MQGQVATRNHRAAEPTPHRAYQDHARYDNNGNMTQMPQLTMSYDVANRMTTSNHASAGTQIYGYNHANQRVFVRNGNTVTYYLYGLGGERLMEFQETCTSGACGSYTENQRWIYFAGRKMFQKTGTTLKAITPNRLASEAKHFPYGETDGTPPADTKDYFATYRRDGTGLDYAWNRYYSPTMGRFTTADPYAGSATIRNPDSWNRYVYSFGNPVSLIDKDGLVPCGSTLTVRESDGAFVMVYYECDVYRTGGGPTATNRELSIQEENELAARMGAKAAHQAPGDTNGSPFSGMRRSQFEELIAKLMLKRALERVKQALLRDECAGLFGTSESRNGDWNPVNVASNLYSENGGGFLGGTGLYLGHMFSSVWPAIAGAEAVTGPAIAVSVRFPTQVAFGYRVDIHRDTFTAYGDLSGGMVDVGTAWQAATLLHEMGHVYGLSTAFGSGGSSIQNDMPLVDWSGSISTGNQTLVLKTCFPELP
jgi:RHS repeat-associated protein